MSHHKYMAIIGSAGVVSFLAWILVLNKLSPFENTGMTLTLFYLSLFVAMSCLFTVLGFYFRVWLNKNEVFYSQITVAFRQGTMLTVIALGCLTFQLLGILTWWSGLLLIICVTLIEFYLMARSASGF